MLKKIELAKKEMTTGKKSKHEKAWYIYSYSVLCQKVSVLWFFII